MPSREWTSVVLPPGAAALNQDETASLRWLLVAGKMDNLNHSVASYLDLKSMQ